MQDLNSSEEITFMTDGSCPSKYIIFIIQVQRFAANVFMYLETLSALLMFHCTAGLFMYSFQDLPQQISMHVLRSKLCWCANCHFAGYWITGTVNYLQGRQNHTALTLILSFDMINVPHWMQKRQPEKRSGWKHQLSAFLPQVSYLDQTDVGTPTFKGQGMIECLCPDSF